MVFHGIIIYPQTPLCPMLVPGMDSGKMAPCLGFWPSDKASHQFSTQAVDNFVHNPQKMVPEACYCGAFAEIG